MRTRDVFSRRQLRKAIRADVEQLIQETTQAVNTAPGGRVIAASEGPVREAMARFRTAVFEKAMGLRTQAAGAAFSPSAGRDGPSLVAQGDASDRSSDE